MNLSERIKSLLEYKHQSAAAFAAMIGVKTPQAIRDIINGKTRSLSENVKNKILAALPEVSTTWLLTGEGAMLKSVGGTTMMQNSTGDNSQNVQGNGITYHQGADMSVVSRLIDELAAQRRLTEQVQEQNARLITLLEHRDSTSNSK